MAYYKEIATAAGTLVCAVGIGFIMQSSDTAESRYGADTAVGSQSAAQAPAAAADTSALDGPVLDVHDIVLTSALEDAPGMRDTVVALAPADTLVTPDTTDVAPGQSCTVNATAKTSGLGLVDLTVTAPCFANERLTVHHSGMRFTETTDATGALDLSMPVLADPAVIVVAFANGDGAVAQTAVPSLGDFDRVVLQWKGDAGFQIHAREFGADYGTEGDIWAESPGDPVQAISGEGGFLVRLGDPTASEAMVADIYTYPSGASRHAGVVDLSAEVEVSLFNCGLEIEAQSLELRDSEIMTRNLNMTVPGCDTIGSFLVLNNLIQDLTVAQK
ncbi:hypothetical protein [Pseudosulfitobacter pseudonitzschiae]|uniref:hypothetical protein n=1 Tax=Pseudosulfitobacter pseudonitzschiae TaxID=1402135 RepID=UPI001AF8D8AC|nr:hypothetical protein [Pseudosulfitobacter pseudonitzschiae]MBM1815514.1 hypothetical protein [Pseudosulfitobacter pseudonitzschiae]MBM1832505.1 hypothetical protein [Pseudosulfitobacter pseudonitzschiae]MBM1837373.1 hypothetical protein [Pseudosulfitobacter pseudonitzschiae]MBM1842219.1 hypothetical protein [Pseudosulfitobacter pseudonitzschiae]MBM1847087.1 hypothetical protein [Pseudosulfitobacter pseudonitzschiae]